MRFRRKMTATSQADSQEKKMPLGVLATGSLTLLSSIVLALLFMMLVYLNFIHPTSMAPEETAPSLTLQNFPIFFCLAFAVYAFFASVAIMFGNTSRRLWRLLMTYWVLLIPYFLWVTVAQFPGFAFNLEWGWLSAVGNTFALLLPFIYAAGCLTYFLTKTPKEYLNKN